MSWSVQLENVFLTCDLPKTQHAQHLFSVRNNEFLGVYSVPWQSSQEKSSGFEDMRFGFCDCQGSVRFRFFLLSCIGVLVRFGSFKNEGSSSVLF